MSDEIKTSVVRLRIQGLELDSASSNPDARIAALLDDVHILLEENDSLRAELATLRDSKEVKVCPHKERTDDR